MNTRINITVKLISVHVFTPTWNNNEGQVLNQCLCATYRGHFFILGWECAQSYEGRQIWHRLYLNETPSFRRVPQMTALYFSLNWKNTMLVRSPIPSGALPLAGVKHFCLMYTHVPSAFTSITPASSPPSHALFPQAPCCPSLFIEYIFYSATFFHLSWQLQLLWRRCTRGRGASRTPVFSLHASCSSERGPSRLKWSNREDDLDLTFGVVLLFILFKKW